MTSPADDARREIADALKLFAWILDHRAWERVPEILTPDAEAYGVQGIDAVIEDNLRRYLGGCGPTQHLLGNMLIDVDADTATSVTYARVFHQGLDQKADSFWECMGEYHDRWRRTSAGWRMSHRAFDVRIAIGDMSVLQPG